MNNKKIILFAYSQLGFDALSYLYKNNYHIACIFTHEDDSKKEHIWFSSAKDFALQNKIPVKTPPQEDLHTYKKYIQQLNPCIILSTYYRYMIPMDILNIPLYGSFNIHGSLLPHYRGRAPVNWAILNGEKKTGLTLHEMVEKPDAGAIIDQKECTIDLFDTAGDITKKLSPLLHQLLKDNIDNILLNQIIKKPFDIQTGSYYSGRSQKDSEIHVDQMEAYAVHNLVRALQPSPQYPAAYIENNHSKMLIHQTNPLLENKTPLPKMKKNKLFSHVYTDDQENIWLLCNHRTWLKIEKHDIVNKKE